jgi:hypothetical protein
MTQFVPGLSDLLSAALAIALFVGFAVVGAAASGKDRRQELDPLTGWGILCLPFVVLGTLTELSFTWIDVICIAIIVLAVALSLRRKIAVDLADWLPYLLLSLPFLAFVAPTEPYGWDQLSHWLPNTNYIFGAQHFPHEAGPPIASAHAGYPYGFPLAIYWVEMASRVFGSPSKIVGVAATLNVLLFVVAARMLVERVRGLSYPDTGDARAPLGVVLFENGTWLAAAIALLLMTALSPTFLPTNSISASPDNATSVVLLAIALTILPRERTSERERTIQSVQLSLLLVLNVYLKEDNAVPALALLAGRVLWDARAGNPPWRTLRGFGLVSIPMLAVAFLWHSYAFLHIAQGEMSMRAPALWRADLLPRILLGMAGILLKKVGFLILLVATLFLGIRSLSRGARPDDQAGAAAVIAGAGFVGYTLFLAFAYISIFSDAEAERHAAFWRYETHLGLVLECAVILGACGMVVRQRLFYSRLAGPVSAVMLLAPIILAPVIRPDLDPQSKAVRAVGNDARSLIADARDIYVVDQAGSGAPCPMIVYEAKSPVRLAECVTKISPCPACMIRTASTQGEFMLTNGWSGELTRDVAMSLAPDKAHLLRRANGRWTAIADWPGIPTKAKGVRAIWQKF